MHNTQAETQETKKRKDQHLDIVLKEQVEGKGITTGLERYRFVHDPLPEIDYQDIRLETEFLGKPLSAPFLIASMTGGTPRAAEINRMLASLAQRRGWALGVGSMRVIIEQPDLLDTFQVRRIAPDVPILANLGAVQLNYGFGADECLRVVDAIEADGLVLHLNSMQEVFQPEGNTNFRGLLRRMEELIRSMPIPVGVKEVGWGISGETAERLAEAGVAFIDVAGAGGTSWSQVEKHRNPDPVSRAAADAFADWGIPTAECIIDVKRRCPELPLIASGGLQNGVDVAKSLALGADLAAFARSLLVAAASEESLEFLAERFERELRIAMFGIGAASIAELRATSRLKQVH